MTDTSGLFRMRFLALVEGKKRESTIILDLSKLPPEDQEPQRYLELARVRALYRVCGKPGDKIEFLESEELYRSVS